VERLASSLPAEQAKALMNQEDGQQGEGGQGQAWQQQDAEAFLTQLSEVGSLSSHSLVAPFLFPPTGAIRAHANVALGALAAPRRLSPS
jgi:hypothetical protein